MSDIFDAARLCRTFAARCGAGSGAADTALQSVSIGLIDGSIDLHAVDLEGAFIEQRDFVGLPDQSAETITHGTNMATLLVGQGRERVRGVVPRARLLAARVVGPQDVATPERITAAIEWLIAEDVGIIAMPIGSERDSPVVSAAIERGVAAGAHFFAASGCGQGPVLFPARHSLVLAVGPADDQGRLLPDARCSPKIDLVAPGDKIPGLTVENASGTGNGSSIACVLAAGMAALNHKPGPPSPPLPTLATRRGIMCGA